MRSMARDQQLQFSPRREAEILPPTRKTRSLSVGSLMARCPTPPSRATFPFKPASVMTAMQTSPPMATVQTPRSPHATSGKIKTGAGVDRGTCQLPPVFHPRPLVAALSPQNPRRCATFPTYLHNKTQTSSPLPKGTDWFISGLGGESTSPIPTIEKQTSSPRPKLPGWFISGLGDTSKPSVPNIEIQISLPRPKVPDWFGLGKKYVHPFPISIHLPTDVGRWWLREMAAIIARRPSDIVHAGAVEIELVQSPSVETELAEPAEVTPEDKDAITEVQVKVSITHKMDCIVRHPNELNNSIAKVDTTTTTTQHCSFDQKAKLQEKMKELRAEMDQAKEIDPGKRRRMEKLLRRVEEAIEATEHEKNETQCNESSLSTIDHIRKTTVAITGGTLSVAGVLLIPCPVVPGILVVYAGLMILASEFDAAKNALDLVKEPIRKWLADDEVSDADATNDEKGTVFWEDLIGYNPDEFQWRRNEIDDTFMAMVTSNKMNQSNTKNVADGKKNPLKPFLRKMLNLDPAVESGNTRQSDDPKDETKGDRVSVPGDSPHSAIGRSEPDTAIEIDLSGVIVDKSIAHAGRHDIECSIALSAHDDDAVSKPIRLFSRENTFGSSYEEVVVDKSIALAGKHDIEFQRLCSEGSIALDTLDDDAGGERIRLFSSQNTIGSSYGTDGDCLWVRFDSSSAFLEEECHSDSGSVAIEKK